jgi:DNA-binding transcriptional LysR family regulator
LRSAIFAQLVRWLLRVTSIGLAGLAQSSDEFGLTLTCDLAVVAHATDQNVDIVGENYDIAIRAHSDPLPDSTLVQRTLTPAPWLLFSGSAYLDAHEEPQTPKDLQKHASLFMMRTGGCSRLATAPCE